MQVKYKCTASKCRAMQENFFSSWQFVVQLAASSLQFAVAVTQNANIAKLRSKFCFIALHCVCTAFQNISTLQHLLACGPLLWLNIEVK